MADITLRLRMEGFADFARALRKLPGEISGEILETALVAGAGIIHEAAASKAPRPAVRRRPGTVRLADSIKVMPAEKDAAHAVVYVGSKVPYAHLVEFGHQIVARGPTRKRVSITRVSKSDRVAAGASGFVAARPYLRPAFDENRERVVQRIGQVLGKEIEAAFRQLAPKARVT